MEEIIDFLILRMAEKDVLPMQIPRLLRDILLVIGDGEVYTAAIINKQLKHLGWEDNLLDNYIFELILHLIETESCCRVEIHNIQ